MTIRGYYESQEYCYRAVVKKIVNRSTVYLDIDLGFSIFKDWQKYRVFKIDGHAYRSKAIDAKWKVQRLLPVGTSIVIRSDHVNGKSYCEIFTDSQPSNLYHYNSYVTNIVDGDTMDIDLDLGFSTHYIERFRLYGIDAWESRGLERAKGLSAKARVEELTPVGANIMTKTIKDAKGKYGRYLGDIYMLDNPMSVNQILVEEGHAVKYE
jgi:micrococcal nuclease